MKNIVMVIVCVIICFVVQAADASTTLRLSHHRPVDSTIDVDLKEFAEKVKSATEGRVVIEIFPAAQLGGSEIVMERVGIGAIDMVLGYPTTTMDPRFDIYNIPALAKNYEELQALFSQHSPFMQQIKDVFADYDLHVLMSYCVSFVGLGLKEPVDGMLDANATHKEKIRTATLNSFRYPAEAVGYLSTPIPMGDLFTALQTGIVDGSYGNGPEVVYLQFRDVIKDFIPIRAQSDIFFLVINKDTFAGLDERDQEQITKLAIEFETERFAIAADEEVEWMKKLEEKGTTIHELSDDQLDSFHKKIQEYSWAKLRSDIGNDFFDDAIQARDAALGL